MNNSTLWARVSVMDWFVPSKNAYICWNPSPQMTVFGDGAFKEIIKIKWGHKVGALIQKDWWPYKKRKRNHTDLCLSLFLSLLPLSPHTSPTPHSQRKGHVSTQREGSHLRARKKSLLRNQPCQNLDLGLRVPRTVRNKCLWLKSPSLCDHAMAAWADKDSGLVTHQDHRDPKACPCSSPSPFQFQGWNVDGGKGDCSSLFFSPLHKQTESCFLVCVCVCVCVFGIIMSHLGVWAWRKGEVITGGPICPWCSALQTESNFNPDQAVCNFWQCSYLINLFIHTMGTITISLQVYF